MQAIKASNAISFTTVVPFSTLVSYLGQHNVTGALNFTRDTSGAQPGYGSMARLVANGTNAPTFTGFKKSNSSKDYANTSGVVNVILFLFDGVDYWYSIYQDASVVSGGGSTPSQLSTPTGFSATAASYSQINLAWNDVSGEINYKLYRHISNNLAGATLIASPAAGATSYNDTGLTASSTYYYWLVAVGDGSTTTDSAAASTSAATNASGATQLSTPSGFTATASGTDILLAWNDVANESSYLIEVSDNGTSGWSTLISKAAGSTSHTHAVGTNSTQKFYRLSAVGNGTTYSNSGYASANATTQAGSSYTEETITFETYSDPNSVDTDRKLAQGANGYLLAGQYAANAYSEIVGFKNPATPGNYSTFKVGFWIENNTNGGIKYTNEGAYGTAGTATVGHHFRIEKSGANGTTAAYKLQSSANGTFSDAVTVYDFEFNQDIDLYAAKSGNDNKFPNIKGANFSAV